MRLINKVKIKVFTGIKGLIRKMVRTLRNFNVTVLNATHRTSDERCVSAAGNTKTRH